MRTKDSALKLLRDILFGDPVIRQEERIEQAMLAVAKCQGDIDQCRHMVKFYETFALVIDPFKDWWMFARRMQKLHDYREQLDVLVANLERLHARLDAIRGKT